MKSKVQSDHADLNQHNQSHLESGKEAPPRTFLPEKGCHCHHMGTYTFVFLIMGHDRKLVDNHHSNAC